MQFSDRDLFFARKTIMWVTICWCQSRQTLLFYPTVSLYFLEKSQEYKFRQLIISE